MSSRDHEPSHNSGLAVRWTTAKAYKSYYVGQYLFLGVYLPFFPGWLDSKGFTEAAIGAIGGGALVLRLMLAPPLAYRADGLDDARTAQRLASGMMALLAAALLLPIPNPVIAILGVLIWFMFGVLVPLTDTAVLRADRRGELNYGIARGIGSASFIVGSIGGGWVITRMGDNAVVWWMLWSFALAFAASLSLPKEPRADAEGKPKQKPSLAFAFALFRSKSFLLMIFAAGLVQGSHATYYTFSELHWSGMGYSSFLIGALWASGVISEIILLFFARSICKRMSPVLLIGAGALAATIRWPLVGLEPAIPLLFVLQLLHGLTFGATYIGAIEFLDRAVPMTYRTTAMTIMSALGVGALTGLATMAVGLFFNRYNAFPAYAAMGGLGLFAMGLCAWLYRRWDGGIIKTVPKNGPIDA